MGALFIASMAHCYQYKKDSSIFGPQLYALMTKYCPPLTRPIDLKVSTTRFNKSFIDLAVKHMREVVVAEQAKSDKRELSRSLKASASGTQGSFTGGPTPRATATSRHTTSEAPSFAPRPPTKTEEVIILLKDIQAGVHRLEKNFGQRMDRVEAALGLSPFTPAAAEQTGHPPPIVSEVTPPLVEENVGQPAEGELPTAEEEQRQKEHTAEKEHSSSSIGSQEEVVIEKDFDPELDLRDGEVYVINVPQYPKGIPAAKLATEALQRILADLWELERQIQGGPPSESKEKHARIASQMVTRIRAILYTHYEVAFEGIEAEKEKELEENWNRDVMEAKQAPDDTFKQREAVVAKLKLRVYKDMVALRRAAEEKERVQQQTQGVTEEEIQKTNIDVSDILKDIPESPSHSSPSFAGFPKPTEEDLLASSSPPPLP